MLSTLAAKLPLAQRVSAFQMTTRIKYPSLPSTCFTHSAAETKFHNTLSLVTGGTRGIGLAVVQALSRSGSDVCFLGQSSASLLKAIEKMAELYDPNHMFIPQDLAVLNGWSTQSKDSMTQTDDQSGWISVSTIISRDFKGLVETSANDSNALRFLPLVCDVADSQAVTDVFQKIQSIAGTAPSILVNCAGTCVEALALRTSPQQTEQMINTNLVGTIQASKQFLRSAPRGKSSVVPGLSVEYNPTCLRIVNVGSIVGQRGGEGVAVYSATKAAVEAYTKSLSRELSTLKGLPFTANCVAPGYIDTDMTARTYPFLVVSVTLIPVPYSINHVLLCFCSFLFYL